MKMTPAPMLWTTAVVVVLLGSGAQARPASYDEYLAVQEGDMATVGSLRREVRQPAPQPQTQPRQIATEVTDLLSLGNAPPKKTHSKKHLKNASGKSDEGGFYKTYGSDADGEKGYLKKSFSKGDHGYKSLDTFHKKLGDRYGFEEHEAFGKASDQDTAKHQGKQAKSSSQQKSKHSADDDHQGAGTDVESHYADDGGGESSSEYSEGGEGGEGGEHYGDGDSTSYSDGDSEGYSESYSSGDGDGYGSQEAYSSGGESSGEDGDSYY